MTSVLRQFGCVLALWSVASGSPAALSYTITDLGTLGGALSRAHDINNASQVVGFAVASGERLLRAFVCGGDGPMQDLGSLPGVGRDMHYFARGINGSGQVVGYAEDATSSVPTHAFLYSAGVMQDLGSLGGNVSSASEINDSGQIAGGSLLADGDYHAFRYSGNGPMQDLGTLGGSMSAGTSINSAGWVVGFSFTRDGRERAFLYTGSGPMRDLGTLGGAFSDAISINDRGQIVGTSQDRSGATRPFLYSDGTMRDIGGFEKSAWPTDINNNGQVVGNVSADTGPSFAFFWSGSGPLQNLNTLIDSSSGWVLQNATAINDRGQIVGWGTAPDGYDRAFLLTPIPEPSTLALVLCAVAGLVAVARRRRWASADLTSRKHVV